ncbi:MAG: hypothetical protein AAGC60_02150 [Acidobacteriota bacterium]
MICSGVNAIVCLLLAVAPSVGTPSAGVHDTALFAAVAAALGGEDAWRRIETMELVGEHTSFSRTRPFTIRRMRPDLYRFDYFESTRPAVVAFDGEHAWWHKTFTVESLVDWPVPMPLLYARGLRAEAAFEPPFVRASARGLELLDRGFAELDGVSYRQVDVAWPWGLEESWYLDHDSLLPAARVAPGAYLRMPWTQRTFYGDYRRVGGVAIPHRIDTEIGNDQRVLEIHGVRLGVPLSLALFARPVPPALASFRRLAGSWRVEGTMRPNLEQAALPARGRSTIRVAAGGDLVTECLELDVGAVRRVVRRWWSWDRFAEVVRVVVFDPRSSHLDVLDGSLDGGPSEDGVDGLKLRVSNLDTGTSWRVHDRTFHRRETWSLGADAASRNDRAAFVLELETSLDAGIAWRPRGRLAYAPAQEPEEAVTACSDELRPLD